MMTPDERRAMIDAGYCRISWKHRMVSRIDRSDWKKACSYGADYYRRVLSKDVRTVGAADIKAFPPSMTGPKDYKELVL